MPHRKLSDTKHWQAIGLIKAGITQRRVGENYNELVNIGGSRNF
jgi:hypothetical protein